jgi:hypothetical protein
MKMIAYSGTLGVYTQKYDHACIEILIFED